MHWEQNLFLPPKSTFLRSWQPLLFSTSTLKEDNTGKKEGWIEIIWKVFDYSERLKLVHNGCQMSLKLIKHLKWQLDP